MRVHSRIQHCCAISLVPRGISREGWQLLARRLCRFISVEQLLQLEKKRPPPTTQRNPVASKLRRTGIDPSWARDFPWLVISENDCGEQGILCSIYCKTNRRPVRAPLGKAVWVEVPCKTTTRQSLKEYLESSCHTEAMRVESTRALVKKQGGISVCFDTIVSIQKKAFIGHLKCMHFLAKQEIAHTTNFTSLVNLANLLELLTWGK